MTAQPDQGHPGQIYQRADRVTVDVGVREAVDRGAVTKAKADARAEAAARFRKGGRR